MMKLDILVLTVVFFKTSEAQPRLEIQQHYEFERVVPDSQIENWQWRSEASENKTLRINDELGASRLELTLCVEPYNRTQNVTLSFDDIRYSNDGMADVVKLQVNGISIANFTTVSQHGAGYEWNVFRNSGKLGPPIILRRGSYTVLLTFITDQYGVELDRIRVNALNQNPFINMFCGSKLYFEGQSVLSNAT